MNTRPKSNLYILFFAFVASIGIFRLLVFLVSQKGQQVPPPPETLATMRPICYAMAAIGLLACAGFTFIRTRSSPTWQRFQTNVILALALSELCTISGMLLFLMGAQPGEFNRFAIAS